MNHLAEALSAHSSLSILAAVVLGNLLAQVVGVGLAVRRIGVLSASLKRPPFGPGLELLVCFGMLLVFVACHAALTTSDELLRSALASLDLSQKNARITDAVSLRFYASALTLFGLTLPSLLCGASLGLSLSQRVRRRGIQVAASGPESRRPEVASLYKAPVVIVALGGISAGIFSAIACANASRYLIGIMRTFAALSIAEEKDQAALLAVGIEEARKSLVVAGAEGALTLGLLLAMLCGALILMPAAAERARLEVEVGLEAGRLFWGSILAAGVVGATMIALARPYQAEGSIAVPARPSEPWPRGLGGIELEGPNEAPPLPSIGILAAGRFEHDGRWQSWASIEQALHAARAARSAAAPDAPPLSELIVVCESGIEASKLIDAARRLRALGFDAVHFGFVLSPSIVRPILGSIGRGKISTLRVELSVDSNAPTIRATEAETIDSLARSMLATGSGRVRLDLGAAGSDEPGGSEGGRK